jgi:hypothetical protein
MQVASSDPRPPGLQTACYLNTGLMQVLRVSKAFRSPEGVLKFKEASADSEMGLGISFDKILSMQQEPETDSTECPSML